MKLSSEQLWVIWATGCLLALVSWFHGCAIGLDNRNEFYTFERGLEWWFIEEAEESNLFTGLALPIVILGVCAYLTVTFGDVSALRATLKKKLKR